jgi:hypothetical protein
VLASLVLQVSTVHLVRLGYKDQQARRVRLDLVLQVQLVLVLLVRQATLVFKATQALKVLAVQQASKVLLVLVPLVLRERLVLPAQLVFKEQVVLKVLQGQEPLE